MNSRDDAMPSWLQAVITTNLSWNRPIDKYIQDRISDILQEEEHHVKINKLTEQTERLVARQSKNKKHLRKWRITEDQYRVERESIIQELEQIRSQLGSLV